MMMQKMARPVPANIARGGSAARVPAKMRGSGSMGNLRKVNGGLGKVAPIKKISIGDRPQTANVGSPNRGRGGSRTPGKVFKPDFSQ